MTDESEQNSFRSIGRLVTEVGITPAAGGSTTRRSETSSRDSATTIEAAGKQWSTGISPGAIGLETRSNLPAIAREEDLDNPMALLPQCVASACREKRTSTLYSDHYGYMGTLLLGYEITLTPDIHEADLRQARANIQATMRPTAPKDLKLALAKLRASTISRATAGEDVEFIVTVFAEWLTEYPGDAVIGAISHWRRNHNFWPAEAELRTEVESRCKNRGMMLAALARPTH